MIDYYRDSINTEGHGDPAGRKEPFKKFYTLFQGSLQQMQAHGGNEYVVYVLAREAVAKGVIPEPFRDAFRQAIAKRNAATLQSLLYHVKDYYAALPALP
ncbi:MAG: hypothetical protein AVDCRST_MAG56-2901 [uncultured Cytophagales bacterium]|uniref:Uncharacterized protein n=1 Tax=uncultured Cytophagales bacterium TaxID=158755 RepID=A0A6J4J6N2_9SPHI|nr:MAG: hypothetical protein AVDCRST_MAG56-2901 [uncultured Cytophagales bacterium]